MGYTLKRCLRKTKLNSVAVFHSLRGLNYFRQKSTGKKRSRHRVPHGGTLFRIERRIKWALLQRLFSGSFAALKV